MANGINQLSMAASQQFQLQKATSGYGTPTLGPFTNSFSQSTTSGQIFSTVLSLNSGASQAYDFVSGALTDQFGNAVQMTTFHGLNVLPSSGAIAVKTLQSGGMNTWLSLSGGGMVVPPGANLFYCEQIASGYGFTPAAGIGNLTFLACSGACLLEFGVVGR